MSWTQCISANIGHLSIPHSVSVNVTQVKGIASVVRTNYIFSFNTLKPSGHNIYRQWSIYVPPVVTICTAGWTFINSTFCPHSVFMCFVLISEQGDIISLYRIDWLVCLTHSVCVYCAVRTEYLIRVINKNVRHERAKTLGVTLHLPTALYCHIEQWFKQSDKYSLRPLGNASYWSICHVR